MEPGESTTRRSYRGEAVARRRPDFGKRQPLPELVEALGQLLIWHREHSADRGGERTGRVRAESRDGPRDEHMETDR